MRFLATLWRLSGPVCVCLWGIIVYSFLVGAFLVLSIGAIQTWGWMGVVWILVGVMIPLTLFRALYWRIDHD
jgi:hypothetical protein